MYKLTDELAHLAKIRNACRALAKAKMCNQADTVIDRLDSDHKAAVATYNEFLAEAAKCSE